MDDFKLFIKKYSIFLKNYNFPDRFMEKLYLFVKGRIIFGR